MAYLKYADLLKRQNLRIFLERRQFTIDGQETPVTGRFFVSGVEKTFDINSLKEWLLSRKPNETLEVETLSGERLKLSRLFKDAEFGGKGTKQVWERQEIGLINALEKAIELEKFVPGLDFQIQAATKNYGLAKTGWEPYADVIINQTYGVSCKADHAASLGGGGLLGLVSVVPEMIDNLYDKVTNEIDQLGFKQGDITHRTQIPDFFYEIPTKKIKDILVGNEYMGGPVDYMYVGDMNVTYSIENKHLTLNGDFYNIDDYVSKVGQFYFRVRKRDLDETGQVQIDFETKNKIGYPVIYRNPNNGKNSFRLLIDSRLPSKARIIS